MTTRVNQQLTIHCKETTPAIVVAGFASVSQAVLAPQLKACEHEVIVN